MRITQWHIFGFFAAIALAFGLRERDLLGFHYGITIAGSLTILVLLPFVARRLFKAAQPAKKTDFAGYVVILVASALIIWSITYAL